MIIYLETERLILRRLTVDDADHLLELDSDPDVVRFTHTQPPADSRDVRERVLPRLLAYYETSDHYGYWAAVEKASQTFIGWFHFRPARDNPEDIDLGYRLLPSARGKGYATEGSLALIRKGFTELGTQRVVASALAANGASIRVMEKAGLRLEKKYIYEGNSQEAVKYVLRKEDFKREA
jgi:RimJ/RimL family protein N-acetyltransferase